MLGVVIRRQSYGPLIGRSSRYDCIAGAELPTDYVESIAASEAEAGGQLRDSGRKVQEEWQWKEPEPATATGFSPTDKRQPFLAWLDGNVGVARWAARHIVYLLYT